MVGRGSNAVWQPLTLGMGLTYYGGTHISGHWAKTLFGDPFQWVQGRNTVWLPLTVGTWLKCCLGTLNRGCLAPRYCLGTIGLQGISLRVKMHEWIILGHNQGFLNPAF